MNDTTLVLMAWRDDRYGCFYRIVWSREYGIETDVAPQHTDGTGPHPEEWGTVDYERGFADTPEEEAHRDELLQAQVTAMRMLADLSPVLVNL